MHSLIGKRAISIWFLFISLFWPLGTQGEKLIASDIPGLSKQTIPSLPNANIVFRKSAVTAVNEDLVKAAYASELSYSDNAPLNGWERFQIPKGLKPEGQKFSALVKIDHPGKVVEVVVRGTANFDDVLTDINSTAENDDILDVPLHSGFRRIALQLHNFLKSRFKKNVLAEYKFKLYGHSMGGAVAAILGMYLYETGSPVPLVVTFGAPRFTTNQGAKKYQVLNANTYRVVRCDDVVPFLPPPNFFGWSTNSYEANGNILLLLKAPYFDYSVNTDIERDFVQQLRTELANVSQKEHLAFGHRMRSYKTAVKAISADVLARIGDDLQPVAYKASLQKKLCPTPF